MASQSERFSLDFEYDEGPTIEWDLYENDAEEIMIITSEDTTAQTELTEIPESDHTSYGFALDVCRALVVVYCLVYFTVVGFITWKSYQLEPEADFSSDKENKRKI
ncbi:uncharacterized protein LOC120331870 [Styela clava]|uniref:uncharacterized protein LOC120331870 n=1 Tax=Styela clava TaxID=7725 RepID=UPI00193A8DA8|nr:uncharacterized protein LOC120331870 [Styela clava]XP_039260281.1 uncharacterized protein LOC120336624 [Styela clava]